MSFCVPGQARPGQAGPEIRTCWHADHSCAAHSFAVCTDADDTLCVHRIE